MAILVLKTAATESKSSSEKVEGIFFCKILILTCETGVIQHVTILALIENCTNFFWILSQAEKQDDSKATWGIEIVR